LQASNALVPGAAVGAEFAAACTPCTSSCDERFPEPARKKTPSSMPDKVKPKSHQPKTTQPYRVSRRRVRRIGRTSSASISASTSRGRGGERDADLARCDELRRRMERAMRNESRSGDERRAIYQEQLRAGCT
jgi:hypothetical protein